MSLPGTSPSHPESVRTPVFMGYDAHLDVQQEITNTAARLEHTSVPDVFTHTATGIPLQGDIPLWMQPRLGNNFSHMQLSTAKTPESSEANVSMTLISPQARRAVDIISDATPVEFGRNKGFIVRRNFDKAAIGIMPFYVVADLLDSAVPTTDHGEISKLAEERFALSFDSVAVRTGDILSSNAKKRQIIRQYISQVLLDGAWFNHGSELHGITDRLGVVSAGAVTTYTLDSFQTLPVGYNPAEEDNASVSGMGRAGTIIKHVRYSFAHKNYHESANRRSRKNLDADVTVSLISPDFSKRVLADFIVDQQEDFDGNVVVTRALASIMHSRPAPEHL